MADGTAELKDYQEDAAAFLAARKRALLADEMGVGKTAAVVRACDLMGAKNILVLVPASARLNWIKEFEKFSDQQRPACAIMHGAVENLPEGIVVCSYDLLNRVNARRTLLARDWDVLVADEAHYLKQRTAKRTKAVYGRRCDGGDGSLAAKARRLWCLSGTPAPNNVSELWTHLHAAGLYAKTWYEFVGEFCKGFESDYGFRITGTKNAERLRAILKPWVLRRTKDDVLSGELPPITFETCSLEPGPVDVEIHFMAWLQGRSVEQFNAEIERQNAELAALGVTAPDGGINPALAAQVSGTAQLRRYVGLSIVDAYLARIRAELTLGVIDKVVVFAHHAGVIEAIRAGLQEFNPVTLYGATPADKRERNIAKFQTNPKCRVFIGNLVAAGTAITLTAACRLDFVEMSWVPGENAQAAMRIHRVGQTRPCHVRFFGCAKGIHHDIAVACAEKTAELVKAGF